MILKYNFCYSVENGLPRRARIEETGKPIKYKKQENYCCKTDEMVAA